MRFVVHSARIKPAEVSARLDQRRDAACKAIAFRMPFAQFCGQQVGQLDLADFALDLVISHLGVEIVFEAVLAEQLDKQFLREIGVSSAGALFDQQAGAARGAHEGMVRDYAVQIGPETIDVRRAQALNPSRIFRVSLGAARFGLGPFVDRAGCR